MQHVSRIELEEVDRLGGVAIGFGPGFRDFINHPGRQFVFARAHQFGNAKEQLCAFFRRNAFPRLKSLAGTFDGAIGQFLRRFVKASDDLRATGGIDAVDLSVGLDALAANHQGILPAELAVHLLERREHRVDVVRGDEISKWFVAKFGWHDYSSFRFRVQALACRLLMSNLKVEL